MKYDSKITSLLILLFSATLILTSCGSNEKKEEVTYERLTPDQNISNVVINGDVANFVQLFDYLLPGYEKVEICFDEFNKLSDMEIGMLYIYNEKCNPESNENRVYFSYTYKNRDYSISFVKAEQVDMITGKHDKSCFLYNMYTIEDEYYGVHIYAFTDEDMGTDFYAKSEYCPDKKEFDNEYLQYSNLIFDSVDLITK